MRPKKNNGGYIALVSVLISGALLLLIGVGSALRGVDALNEAAALESSFRAESAADSCAEEAILKLKANFGYAGNELIIVEGNTTCSILAIGGSGNTDRTIDTKAGDGQYIRNVHVDIASLTPLLQIRSWSLVP
jgi:hypothetical protein